MLEIVSFGYLQVAVWIPLQGGILKSSQSKEQLAVEEVVLLLPVHLGLPMESRFALELKTFCAKVAQFEPGTSRRFTQINWIFQMHYDISQEA
jgi:hypothetical protein